MTDTMKTEQRREAFEKWAKSRGHDTTIYGDGNYADEVIDLFDAWCAALDSQAAQAQPSAMQLIEAGWQAALDCHAHYGMAGWSSHRKEYLSKAASPSPNDPPSDHPPITWSGDVKVEPGEL